jgi:glycosyltransferase involved in cell wall biosynthesis
MSTTYRSNIQNGIRILFIGGYKPFKYRKAGGPNAVSSPLIEMLALNLPKGIEVTVLSTPFKDLTLPLIRPTRIKLGRGVTVKYVPLLSAMLLITSEIAKAHLVHVFAGGELFSILIQIIAKILGKKVVVTFHGYRPLALYFEGRHTTQLKRKLLDTLFRLSIKLSDAVTFVSNFLGLTFKAAGIPVEKSLVIHNGTDMKPHYKARVREEIMILSVTGGHPYRKGLDILLNALGKLKSRGSRKYRIRLVVVGRVPEELMHVINLVQEGGIQVSAMRNVSREKLLEYYSTSHICVQLSRYDSFNLPALEAASQGCAVIVSNRAGVAEVLRECAIVVDVRDTDYIVGALQKLLVNYELREELGRKCSSLSRMYTYDKVALRYLKCYMDVLRGQKAGHNNA